MDGNINFAYPSQKELNIILNDYVKRSDLLAFLKSKGIIYYNITLPELSDLISRFVFDYDELNELRLLAYRGSNKHLLTGFNLVSNNDFDFDGIYNAVVDYDSDFQAEGYKLNKTCVINLNGKLTYQGSITYEKRSIGKIDFIRKEKRDVTFSIKQVGDRNWQIEVDGGRSSDGKNVLLLIDKIIKKKGNDIHIEQLDIGKLSMADTIVLFDRLSQEGFPDSEWLLCDVARIYLRENKDDDKEHEVPEAHLAGISQAILEGNNLRDNLFVHHAELNGYMFTSMTYIFRSTDDSKRIKIRAEFKGNPKIFEICLESYLEKEEDDYVESIVNLDDCHNLDLRSRFWNKARDIYEELVHCHDS